MLSVCVWACRGGEEAVAGRYLREWQTHVLANLPFYELLMPRFLALTRERVSSQGDAALADVLKVHASDGTAFGPQDLWA